MIVQMPYIGGDLTDNNHKIIGKGGRKTHKTKRVVEIWMVQLKDEIRTHPEYMDLVFLPVTVTVNGYFIDKVHSPDIHNLSKVTMDTVKVAIGMDDKYCKFITGDRHYGYNGPYLEIKIEKTI